MHGVTVVLLLVALVAYSYGQDASSTDEVSQESTLSGPVAGVSEVSTSGAYL